ncbi:MAG: SdrD B-like domain-containing protein, partial [Thermoanaerobaculia bacterium]
MRNTRESPKDTFDLRQSAIGSWSRRPATTGWRKTAPGLILMLFGLLGTAPVTAQDLVQTFFVPVAESDVRTWADVIQVLPENAQIHSVISITPTADGTIIYYDQWENGYEADLGNPTDVYGSPGNLGGTQIWGDNDPSNGIPSGFVSDVVNSGDVIVLESDVPLPRDPVAANNLFDGRDKFSATELLAVTRAAWPSTGIEAQLGGATEVPDTGDWCTRFESPLGEDAQVTPDAFEWVAVAIIAEKDDTLVSVDANADGDFLDAGDLQDQLFDQGETVLVESILVGAVVQSTGLVNVDLLTADANSTYEGRWFSLIPFIDWGNSYFSPVGDTTTAGIAVHAYLYNPGTSAITVTEDDLLSLGDTFSVPAGSVFERQLPENATPSAVHFFTAGNEPFYALVAVDRNGQVHDWGYTLIPERNLTIRAAVGWAPATTDPATFPENASPVWVTPVSPTTFEFDCDGDGAPDFTSPSVAALESYRVNIPSVPGCTVNDATGMQITTVGDIKFAAAWGQDPANSGSGQSQQLDMGTSVLPIANPYLLKSSQLIADVNGNGSLDPGDTLLFTLTIDSTGTTDVLDVVISDQPDLNTTYVPNSTFVDGSTQIPDGVSTPFPLDEGGFNLGNLSPGQTLVITYQSVLDDPLAQGVNGIVNTATIAVEGEFVSSSTATEPIPASGYLNLVKVADRASAAIGETANYFYIATNNSSQYLSGSLSDDLIGDIVPPTARIEHNLQVFYPFDEGSGTTVNDRSGLSPVLGLTVEDPANVSWGSDTLSIISATRVSNGTDSNKIFSLCTSNDEITVEAWITPANTTQAGPARIVTQSLDGNNRNFTLGQNGAAYQFRLRTTTNGLNGTTVTLNGGVVQTTQQHVVATRDAAGNAFLYVDGAQVATATISGDFSNWNASYDFGLANEFGVVSTDPVRAWLGQYDLVTVQCDALSAAEVLQNFQAGSDPYLEPGETVNFTDSYIVQAGDAPGPVINTATALGRNPARTETLRGRDTATVNIPAAGAGAIGDLIWLDIDGDGVFDIGEPGLGGVTVELRDGVCTTGVNCPTTVTDAAGRYIFDQLVAGTYEIFVDETTLPANLVVAPGTSNPVSSLVITGSERLLDVDLGYVPATGTGVIGDFLWSDADNDGVQDAGEIGIGGVTLELRDGVCVPGSTCQTTTTAADGSYHFTGVAPGQYTVQVTDTGGVLSGYAPTSGPQSPGSLTSAPLTVAAGQVISNTDFGFQNPILFAVSDALWYDLDGDGFLDGNESGIAGVTANLLDDSGQIIASISDVGGQFSFSGLPNGSFTIEITDVNGVLQGLAATTLPAAAGSKVITIAGGDVNGVSFGYQVPGLIGDVIWSDADGDGVRDPGESGLAGVTLELQDGVCVPASTCSTTTTAADGSYSFAGVSPGAYTVVVTDTSGVLTAYLQTGDPDETGTCVVCDGQGIPSLLTTVTDLTMDFGYRNASLGDVSGTIFNDLDADGVEDAGESGIAGVSLVLLDSSGNEIAVTTTDANGSYSFPDLPNGDYTVQVTDDLGLLDGSRLTSGLDALDVTMTGSDIVDVDFGYVRDAMTAAIGDRLWLDADGDGQAGPSEAGLAGVTVELWEDTDGDGVLNPANDTLLAMTVTDANGDYLFDALSAGNYFVDVDGSTLPATGGGDLVETTYPAGVNPSAVIALSATERFGSADFGYVPATGTVVLGDRVWSDADGNGLQDPGELGIGGVEIQLLGPGCDPTPCTVTTEPDGSWLVTGLPPGDFLVTYDSATLPSGYNTIPTNLDPDDTYNVTVVANDVMTQLDFGFDRDTPLATIGDRVWLDEDGDGAQDAGEPGLAGVTVNLVDSSGNIVATTTTAADGSYLFSGVPDGDYTVSLSDIDGVLVGLPQSYDPDEAGVCTTCDRQGSVTVSGGVSTPADVDFGFAPSGGTGTIGDFVWHDADGDGVQDLGESGIQGVTLELWLDVNGDGVITPGLDNLVRNSVTDQNGEYQFSSLPDEEYVVRVTDTAGVVSAFVQTGDPDEVGTCSVCDEQGVLTLTGGSGDFGQDFGYAAPAGTAYSISGTVFDDQNQDGDFDSPGESGVEGALVLLFNDLNGDGVLDPDEPLLGSTVTDADGNYSLIGLPPGDYLVAVDTSGTGVDGYLQTTQTLTAGLQAVTVPTNVPPGNAIDQDFGFWSGGYITTPVTLAYFSSEGSGSVSFQWATATETGNLGFHLYVLEEEGLRRLNETLIPSQVGDALTPQRYALEAWGVEGD